MEIQNLHNQEIGKVFEPAIQNTPDTGHNVRLTSAELANLWAAYMHSSLKRCTVKYFLAKVEDKEIRLVLEFAMHLAEQHLQTISELYRREKHPIPTGFTDKDVNPDAPRLFSDTFFLAMIEHIAMIKLSGYATALLMAARKDVRQYFAEFVASAAELYNRATDLLLAKGMYMRAPYIPVPDQVNFARKQTFLTGFSGERRTIDAIEISHIFTRMKTNALRITLFEGFSKVAESKQIRDYMIRGKEIATKHVKILNSLLLENNLPAPMTWDPGVFDSSASPYSEKFMTEKIRTFNVLEIAEYGKALSVCMRHDISVTFLRLMTEVGKYAEDGLNILIDNGWMEESPQAPGPDHNKKKMH